MSIRPMAALIQSVAEELRNLAGSTEDLHRLVCHDHLEHDVDYIQTVQSIDRTTQILDNLSTFLAAIGEEANEEWNVALETALGTIRLSELKRRLHPAANDAQLSANDGADDDGDLELFG
ncbi:hypothetical protein [Aurantimonas sp. VKM B-3413]|uniref:hypothetical protein n=1 Tax=Aurantimonas sp. VKM B-3413 TaxID=2779401 RepID=UPI001E56A44B|nr:hypothetical protein [Aurantimonas sp. VKM B-3413]MCB8836642.1 hypothetical protein [Aurantimonas sp. VKM B-3413]